MYGCSGLLKSSPTSATSTMLPAYITATLSHTSATTPRSCVISMTDESISFLSSRRSWRICACTVTSSAVVISSARNTFGLLTRAMAIMALCLIPPESSNGYILKTRSGSGSLTMLRTETVYSRASLLSSFFRSLPSSGNAWSLSFSLWSFSSVRPVFLSISAISSSLCRTSSFAKSLGSPVRISVICEPTVSTGLR